MTNYFLGLAQRTLGLRETLQPSIASMFEPGMLLMDDYVPAAEPEAMSMEASPIAESQYRQTAIERSPTSTLDAQFFFRATQPQRTEVSFNVPFRVEGSEARSSFDSVTARADGRFDPEQQSEVRSFPLLPESALAWKSKQSEMPAAWMGLNRQSVRSHTNSRFLERTVQANPICPTFARQDHRAFKGVSLRYTPALKWNFELIDASPLKWTKRIKTGSESTSVDFPSLARNSFQGETESKQRRFEAQPGSAVLFTQSDRCFTLNSLHPLDSSVDSIDLLDESLRPGEWNSRLHRQSVPTHTNSHLSRSVRAGGLRLFSPEFYLEGIRAGDSLSGGTSFRSHKDSQTFCTESIALNQAARKVSNDGESAESALLPIRASAQQQIETTIDDSTGSSIANLNSTNLQPLSTQSRLKSLPPAQRSLKETKNELGNSTISSQENYSNHSDSHTVPLVERDRFVPIANLAQNGAMNEAQKHQISHRHHTTVLNPDANQVLVPSIDEAVSSPVASQDFKRLSVIEQPFSSHFDETDSQHSSNRLVQPQFSVFEGAEDASVQELAFDESPAALNLNAQTTSGVDASFNEAIPIEQINQFNLSDEHLRSSRANSGFTIAEILHHSPQAAVQSSRLLRSPAPEWNSGLTVRSPVNGTQDFATGSQSPSVDFVLLAPNSISGRDDATSETPKTSSTAIGAKPTIAQPTPTQSHQPTIASDQSLPLTAQVQPLVHEELQPFEKSRSVLMPMTTEQETEIRDRISPKNAALSEPRSHPLQESEADPSLAGKKQAFSDPAPRPPMPRTIAYFRPALKLDDYLKRRQGGRS